MHWSLPDWDWNAVGTWAGIAVSVGIALLAGRKAGRAQTLAAKAQERSAAALEEIAAARRPPAITWQIMRLGAMQYGLVNEGTTVATDVRITGPPRALADIRRFPQGEAAHPHEPLAFQLPARWDRPHPTHLLVACNEAAEQSVPMPPRPS